LSLIDRRQVAAACSHAGAQCCTRRKPPDEAVSRAEARRGESAGCYERDVAERRRSHVVHQLHAQDVEDNGRSRDGLAPAFKRHSQRECALH